MSVPKEYLQQHAIEEAKGLGVTITLHDDFAMDQIKIHGRIGNLEQMMICDRLEVENGQLPYRISQVVGQLRSKYFGDGILTTGTPGGEADLFRRKFKDANLELERYKVAVKKLAFDLEMARGGNPALAKHDEIRKVALEQAAEFLMDHGVITTGPELEAVCKQIKQLSVSEVRV